MTPSSLKHKPAVLYIAVTGLCFLVLFVIFIFFPRPSYSELEKRDLASFPKFEDYKENLAGYTAGISDWFSNTEPFRDKFLTMSMGLRNSLKLKTRNDSEAVSFHATSDSMEETPDDFIVDEDTPFDAQENLAEENAKVANAGIIVAGNEPNVRAMMAFGGGENSGGGYISTVNNYAEAFPDVNIYSVIASSSGEFYMPEKVKGRNKPETPTLENIKSKLSPRVKSVDVHSALKKHANEDIFLRTDHHWAPLGAYYAAEAFASAAGVPFKDLESYQRHVLKNYVGSMYGYSKDIAVKNSPEDFVYFTPDGLDYTTTFITYNTNSNFQVTSETKPYQSSYFKHYKDGSGAAYCTFMGGDQSLVHVKTGAVGNRKLLVIKDSFGNAFPGYLFYSFSDVHVVDFRYFNKNIKKYVEDNGITDIAFVFNIFNVCNGNTFKKVNRFLTQRDGEIIRESTPREEAVTESNAVQKSDSIPPPKVEKEEIKEDTEDVKSTNSSSEDPDNEGQFPKSDQTNSEIFSS